MLEDDDTIIRIEHDAKVRVNTAFMHMTGGTLRTICLAYRDIRLGQFYLINCCKNLIQPHNSSIVIRKFIIIIIITNYLIISYPTSIPYNSFNHFKRWNFYLICHFNMIVFATH